MCLGIPAQIVAVTDAPRKLARVSVGGVQREVNCACILDADESMDALLHTWVLVHVGFAMARIDAAEAERTLALMAELAEAQEELAAFGGGGTG